MTEDNFVIVCEEPVAPAEEPKEETTEYASTKKSEAVERLLRIFIRYFGDE